MLQTIAKLEVRGDQTGEFLRVFNELAEATKKEAGCIQYEMYQDEGSASTFVLLEQWTNKASFDAHLESEHFKRIIPLISACLAKESQLGLYKRIA